MEPLTGRLILSGRKKMKKNPNFFLKLRTHLRPELTLFIYLFIFAVSPGVFM